MELRGYQQEAVAALRAAIKAGKKRIMLYSPTGSGKTEMAIEVIRGAERKKRRSMFTANRINLVSQTSKRLDKAQVVHGVIQGGNSRDAHRSTLACSIQTIIKRGVPEGTDVLIIDEAHGATSAQYKKLIIESRCPVIIGLSATPFTRGLGKHCDELGGPLFEEMVVAITIRELIDLGYLVDVDIYAPSEPDLRGVKIVAGDYNEKQLSERVNQEGLVGDIVEQWQKLADGQRTVVFATNIDHSKHIVDKFCKAGVPAEHIDCYTSDEDRAAILGRLEAGVTTVVSNVSVLAEGWDCPSVSCMILARPTRSLARFIQMVGRALRPFPGKDRALMLDHSGSVRRLGFPTDDLPLELNDGKKKEPGAPDDDDEKAKERLPKPCPACFFMKPPGVHKCPRCGFEHRPPPVEHKPGDLEKIKRYTMVEKQHFYSQLLHIQQDKGYADGWTSHKYREKFGVWPKDMRKVKATPTPEVTNYLKHLAIKFAKRADKLPLNSPPPGPTPDSIIKATKGWKEEARNM